MSFSMQGAPGTRHRPKPSRARVLEGRLQQATFANRHLLRTLDELSGGSVWGFVKWRREIRKLKLQQQKEREATS